MSNMSQHKGSEFEINTQRFFEWLFEKIGFDMNKSRIQASGTQDGFDVQINISKDYREKIIFIECKNYKRDLDIGNIFKKCMDLEMNYTLKQDDLFIAISPKSNFKNSFNSEKSTPLLNSKFPFHCELLEKSNGIERLFALNREIYKSIYGKELDFEIDEEKEIKRFKSIIYSRKPLKKIVLNEDDKTRFLGDIAIPENYIDRNLSKIPNLDTNYLFSSEKTTSLNEILNTEDKIIVLGNPGLGKTVELKNFALSQWKTGEQESYIPIYKNLKNFTELDTIEKYLPNEFSDIQKCYLILDGIDEIQNQQYFISKLENFINSENVKSKHIKYVVSCRTNIFESNIFKISNFNSYYLTKISYNDAFEYLKKRTNNDLKYFIFQPFHYTFLSNPYQLNLLADYIIDKNELPNNALDLWKSYIDIRLKEDKKGKFARQNLNSGLIKVESEKVALISELMKANFLTGDNLYEILEDKFEDYIKNPLIEIFDNKYNFEHRTIQEYFSAKKMSKYEFEQIIDIIQIPNTTKTHPSLFNTISFLINILDDTKRNKLIDYLSENEPEILFSVDADRIDTSIKNKLFRSYFEKTCIENTFWISHNRTYDVKTIAKFGDSEENFNYLTSIIDDSSNHFRVIISALNLLEYMTIPMGKEEEVKVFLLNKLKDNQGLDSSKTAENSNKIKGYIIGCLTEFKFYKDVKYFKKILSVFSNSNDENIVRSLFELIYSIDGSLDEYVTIIEKELQRNTASNTIYSTFAIEEAILRLNNPENLKIFIERILLNDEFEQRIFFTDEFPRKLVEKCKVIIKNDVSFIETLLISATDRYWCIEDNYLLLFANEDDIRKILITRIVTDQNHYERAKYLLARIIKEEDIDKVCSTFKSRKPDEIEFFRNLISNSNKYLALIFQDKMEKLGAKFKEEIFDRDKYEENQKQIKRDNFDLLFNEDKLIKEVVFVFDDIEKEETQWEDIWEYQKKWYKKNGHPEKINYGIDIVSELVRKHNVLSKNSIKSLLKETSTKLNLVKNFIKNNEVEIDENKINSIQNWCLELISKFDYDKIVLPDGRYYPNSYFLLKNLYFLQTKLDLNFPIDFYKNTLKFSDDLICGIENLFEIIQGKFEEQEFNKMVGNIINDELYPIYYRKHIKYILDKNLKQYYPRIKDLLLKHNILHSENILEVYFEKTKDISLLKEICKTSDSYSFRASIELLSKIPSEKDFVIQKAKEYLKTSDKINQMEMLGVLFQFNLPEAFEYFKEFTENEKKVGLNIKCYSQYNNEIGLKYIEYLFETFYLHNDVLNLSKDRNIITKLSEIKEKHKQKGTDLFHINRLIENSEKAYINFKSKPLSFQEALDKVIKS